MLTRITVLVALAGLLCSSLAIAAPTKLNQQGRLLDGDGAPLTGSHGLAFTLHDAETDGNEVWREERLVQFEEGYYSIVLGDLVPLSDLVFAAGPVWLELNVDGAVLSPRHEVVSVPYALRAAVAESVEGGAVDADEVAIGGNTVIDGSGNWLGTPPDWSDLTGVPADLADGDSDTLLGLPCAGGYIAKYSPAQGAWDCAEDNDSLATLICLTGEIPVYDVLASLWVCGADLDTDTQLSESQVDAFVANNNYAVGPHTTDTNTQLTEAQVDAFVANNGYSAGVHTTDTDTLGGLVCLDGELARWDDVLGLWLCDTDSVLSETDVEAFVTNGAIDLAAGTTLGGVPIAVSGSASFQSSGQVTLTSLNSVTLTPAGPLPQFTHSAWQDVSGLWQPLPYRGGFDICGDGSDGTFTATAGNMTMPGGVYNYTDFNLPVGTTLTVTGSDPLVIHAQNTVVVDGAIVSAGANATGWVGGSGGAGGQNGGTGSCVTGNNYQCYAFGGHGSGGLSPPAICGAALPGAGPGVGGVGCYTYNYLCQPVGSKGGGGGGTGGIVVLQARHVQISGTINISGGNGAVSGGRSGGGGSGGVVFIEASGIELAATAVVDLQGGAAGDASLYTLNSGAGGEGHLIIKARSSTYPASFAGLTSFDECPADAGIPPEVSTYYDTTGLHIRNYGIDPVDVVLNLSE